MNRLVTKFLAPYERHDRDYFYGRDKEILDLTKIILESKLTLLYGLSGTGKTSLVKCGVANEFEEYDWLDLYVRRGENFIDSLREQIVDNSATVVKRAETLMNALQILYEDYFRPIYIIFDQVEELFINGSADEISEFGEALADILNSDLKCKIIVIIREEYFGRLDIFEARVPSIFESRMRLERMMTHVLRATLHDILKSSNIQVSSEGVIDGIIKLVQDENSNVELPYLMVYLDRLYSIATQNAAAPEGIIFDEALISSNLFGDVLDEFLNVQVAQISEKIGDKEFVWTLLHKYFITSEGTKQQFNPKDFNG